MKCPQGWAHVTLDEVGRWGSGGTPKATESSYYGGDIPWIRSGDLPDGPISSHEATISETGLANSSAKWVAEGAVLVAMYGATIGKLGVTKYPVTTNQAIAFVEPFDGIEARYLFENLRYRRPELVALGQGGAQPNISQEILKAQPFALPPLAEQRRIVAKLDALIAHVTRARTELNRTPMLARHLRQAAVSVVATTSDANIVRFDEVLDYKGGSQPPKSAFHSELADGRIRLLQIRDFASDHKAVYIDDNGKWPRCGADDIMIGRYGASVGKILTGKAGAYNVALVKMVFDRTVIEPRFLFHWLKGDTFQGRLREISRSAQDGFNKEDLADLPFPLLSLTEQASAARKADNLLARADRLEAEAIRARMLLDRLESAILAKAFCGELVPQDPSDEPAQALLDRIRAQRAAAAGLKRVRRGKVTK